MKVLFVTPNFPFPPQSGSGLRAYGLIRGLREADPSVRVDLLAFAEPGNTPDARPLAQLCGQIRTVATPARSKQARIRTLLFSGRADMAERLACAAMRVQLHEMLAAQRYDYILYVGLETAIYMPLARQLQPDARQIYDAANVEHVLQQRIGMVDRRAPKRLPAALYSALQVGRIRRAESALCKSADIVTAVSDEDARQLAGFRPDRQITVVPNGIFVEDYAHAEDTLDLEPHALVFTGKMDYRPNIDAMQWFCADVLPRISEPIPDVRLYIVGQKPHPSIAALGSAHVQITGWVPSVAPFLHQAAVYVTPLRVGSGTRLKLLEAAAAGCAIVSTPLGAEGLHPDLQAAMRLVDGADRFASAVVTLLRDADARAQLGVQAEAAAREHYDWSAIIPRLTRVLEQDAHG